MSVSQNGKQGELRGFVLAHVPKPSFGVLIYCGVLACSTEVRKRIVWPPNKRSKKKKKKKVLLVAVSTRGALIRFGPSALSGLLTGKAIFLTFTDRLVCLYHVVLFSTEVFFP